MADSVKVKRSRRLFGLFRAEISPGSAGDEVYGLSVALRRDGLEVKVGQLVRRQRNNMPHLVREILLRGDLAGLEVVLSPVEVRGEAARLMEEIVIVTLDELVPLQQRLISLELARDGMRKVSANIIKYPEHIQRTLRRHQLAALLRDSVQRFLGGFSLARTVSLGCVDWRFDLGILGLDRETDYSLEYKVEQYVELSSHLDLILGQEWDVRRICGGEGHRVILTLELRVDTRQQFRLETHATTCPGEPSSDYRRECVSQAAEQISLAQLTVDRLESLHSVRGVSLDWEEFQDCRQFEDTLEISNIETDIASALRGIQESFSDNKEEDEKENTTSYIEEIEETSAALKKLLDTPTRGFSQLVFNVTNKPSGDNIVPDEIISCQLEHKTRHVNLSEDHEDFDEIPNLSPIKLLKNQNVAHSNSNEFLSDFIGTRQSTSTPEGEYRSPLKHAASGAVSKSKIEDHEKPNNETPDNHNDEDDVFSEDYRVSSSNNLNQTNNEVSKEDKANLGANSVQFKLPEYSSSKVRAYVESLPSPKSRSIKDEQDLVEEKKMLDESFDSEASSRSKVSKLSDISNLAGRFTNTALGGQQQVCPFPEEWQFQTIPESIENNEEID